MTYEPDSRDRSPAEGYHLAARLDLYLDGSGFRCYEYPFLTVLSLSLAQSHRHPYRVISLPDVSTEDDPAGGGPELDGTTKHTPIKTYASAAAVFLLLASCRDILCIDSRIWG